MSLQHRLLLSVMMFLQFFLWGSWYVTGPNYLSTIGFKAEDFGTMYSVGPIAGMIAPFFVGMIADRYKPAEEIEAGDVKLKKSVPELLKSFTEFGSNHYRWRFGMLASSWAKSWLPSARRTGSRERLRWMTPNSTKVARGIGKSIST